MKTLFYLLLAFLSLVFPSCKSIKTTSEIKSETFKTKDSSSVVFIQRVDSIPIKEQTVKASISIEILKQLEDFTISENGLKTTLSLRKDTLKVYTIQSADTILVVHTNKKVYQQKDRLRYQKENKESDKAIVSERKNKAPFWMVLTLILAIVIVILLIIKKLFSWR